MTARSSSVWVCAAAMKATRLAHDPRNVFFHMIAGQQEIRQHAHDARAALGDGPDVGRDLEPRLHRLEGRGELLACLARGADGSSA